ncbi:MAG: hypothetical protein UZ01_00144 [Candidatus Brocadia sinica]|nr:hypothetical protein [Candidatus Brocadia sinica]KXK33129.1 MAG: hypothetical protein UZ01_00144 [Candidatus Brocadia sinica]MBL1170789.1 hypothetical protein [Candidatus Brocadia sp. AMX1]MCK6470069.1 hypothetical protein [Candidatus Brocadia sinica]NOG42481.1 hypothetical protein [Planctomycetota bacterium]
MKKFTLLAVTLMLSLIFNFIVESKVNGEAPGTPADLEATAGSGMVNLSWDSVAGATDYNIPKFCK